VKLEGGKDGYVMLTVFVGENGDVKVIFTCSIFSVNSFRSVTPLFLSPLR